MKKTFTILLFLIIYSLAKAQELKLFKELYPGPESSYPMGLFTVQDKMYFTTWNNYYSNKPSLWVTDGVNGNLDSSTFIFKELGSGYFPTISNVSIAGNKFFFFYQDDITPIELWISDGTTSGTYNLKRFDPSSINYVGSTICGIYKDKLYFLGNSDTNGIELWVSDGTEAGTQQLKDINKTGNSAPYNFFEFDDFLYFAAEDTAKNRKLWKTDGTEQGTIIVKDFSGNGGVFSGIFGIYNDMLYLSVRDSINGSELWTSDGTDAGTQLLKDINPTGNSYPSLFTHFKDKIYFTADDGVHGREIWTSDGTETGTKLFIDINKSNENKPTYEFHEVNGMLYFNAYDETNGYELWKTDGTEAGTKIVKNIVADKNKNPYNFASIGNTLFFVADAGNIGEELYMTDGTEVGTKILEPKYRTEKNPVQREQLIVFKEKLFVTGKYEADYGTELYVYDPKENNSSIQTVKNQPSLIYPNPAQNELKIKNNTFSKVDIYDINGKLLLQSTNTKESIDISSIPAGVYIVKLGNDNTQVTERLLKY